MANKNQQQVTTRAPSRVALMIQKIEERADDFGARLPRHIPSDKFVRTLKTAIGSNPDLAECEAAKLLIECQKCAADGLVADGREAVIIVFNTKVKKKVGTTLQETWEKVPKYIPMYQGLIRRARNSGELKAVGAMLVYEEELKIQKGEKKPRFRYWVDSDGKHIEHEPILTGKRGAVAGAYSIATLKDGLVDFYYMPVERLRVIQGRSRSKIKKGDKTIIVGPWASDEEEMMKKTVIRGHSKTLPLDSDIARIFARDDDMYEPEPRSVNAEPPAGKARGVGAARLNGDEAGLGDDQEPSEAEVVEEPRRGKDKPAAKKGRQRQQPEEEEPPQNEGEDLGGDPF